MAQIDASGLGFSFSAFNQGTVEHFAFDNATGDHYTWNNSAAAYRITAFSFDNDITTGPLGGTIDSVNVTNNGYAPGFSITGLDAPLASLIDTGSAAANFEKFWETVLAGVTSVIMPAQSVSFSIMGDFVTVNAGQTRVGAADVFTGSGISNSANVVGDALAVDAGATLTGGNDTFDNISANTIIGDVGNPETASPSNLGIVNGGNDTINLIDQGYTATAGIGSVIGDVLLNGAGGVSNGGDDSITLRNVAFANNVVGDNLTNNGSSVDGDDTILIETTIRGRLFVNTSTIVGDDVVVGSSVSATGGNDAITLNNVFGAYLSGDFYQADNSVAVGGNDIIRLAGTFSLTTPPGPEQINAAVTFVTGDAYSIGGTTAFTGGGDTITLLNAGATAVVGDVYVGSATGAFVGGNDAISVTFNRANTAASYNLAGDAYFANANLFTGGDDNITLNTLGSLSATNNMTGDANSYNATGNGLVTNGDDVLIAVSGVGQQFNIFGDGANTSASGNLTIQDGNDTLIGGAGNDFLYGDTVLPSAGGTLTNVGGNDTLDGRGGNDVINGGLGTDTVVFGLNQSVRVDLNGIAGSSASDLFEAIGQGNDQLVGIENVVGSAQGDVIIGDGGSNTLKGMGGADRLGGGGGSDLLDGGAGADQMAGGAGNDNYVVDNAGDIADESAAGSNGTDAVYSSTLSINLGDATHFKGSIESAVLQGAANLNLIGNGLANTLVGNTGNNILNGGAGADYMRGGAGNDTYVVDTAADIADESIAGSGGTDTVSSAAISIQLSDAAHYRGSIENAVLTGAGNLNAFGNGLANTIQGNSGVNVLGGGLAADSLTGGLGNDVFRFDTALGPSNVDAITDYTTVNDQMQIDNAVFTGLANGALAAAAFFTGAAAHDADDRIIYNSATGALFFDSDGTGAAAQVQFATLSTGLAMAAGEFIVI